MIIPKKKFGQNFLKDESILNKIIESMPKSDKTVVEIGPGLGDLTKKLLEHKKRVIAFEVDSDLCKYLKKKFAKEIESQNFVLICGDVLEKWEDGFLIDEKYDLVANLPYYIATKIILNALRDVNCESLTVMVQKEVALKFCAKEREKNFSSLSILANSICKTGILFDVGRESFEPQPKVVSSVLQMIKFRNYLQDMEKKRLFDSIKEYEKFESFLKEAFKSPRKTLIKNLSLKYEKDKIESFFKEYDLPLNIRPHELSLSLYHLLFKNI